ncbi:interferon-gamma-inducible lysosomal thiol reductase [Elysia marginata]|uniref:Interferon-gamma-inducible lysosomal thiol reductase n=1 Tax=Elysia marginata TaxID=1093978 RepID=A0AAV4EQ03_9GAST|nr:interferon-gamma-inducible lysosomal thiol reductase [Elysia marginata]
MATSCLLFVLAALVSVSLANPAAPRTVAMEPSETIEVKPVNFTLYYESLCPDCQDFISSQLGPTWTKVKDTKLMTVTLLPFGNAREKQSGSQWKFECQHGPNECWGNILETCLIHYYPDTTQQLNIIECIEEDFVLTMAEDWEDSLRKCSSHSDGVDVEKIVTCTKGPEGNKLEHIVASRTATHDYVPWPLIDGKLNKDALDNLLKEVCMAYKGTPPSVCHETM